MQNPVEPKEWLSKKDLEDWLKGPSDKNEYRRRLAVWLNYLHQFHAHEIAEILGVTTLSVWKWLDKYDKNGPKDLKKRAKGGRRWSFASKKEEKRLLEDFKAQLRAKKIDSVKDWLPRLRKLTKKKNASLSYVYKLLYKQGWRSRSSK